MGEPDSNLPSDRPTELQPQQKEIIDGLKKESASLAELYEGAAIMMLDNKLPGRSRFVAHAVREIRNRLADNMGDIKVYKSRLDHTTRLDDILSHCDNTGFSFDTAYSNQPETVAPLAELMVPIPQEVYTKIASLFKDHRESSETKKQTAIRLFQPLLPENQDPNKPEPIVKQWLDITEYFVQRAHDGKKIDTDVIDEQFVNNFHIFERLLHTRLFGGQKFFNVISDINDILEEANN